MSNLSQNLMSKAKRSYKSAVVLFNDGDFDGAVNRSYYAMHDATKAALIHARVHGAEKLKTHSGLISAFSQHLVKTGKVSESLGRELSLAESERIGADYGVRSISKDGAKEILASAKSFLSEIEKKILRDIELE